MTREEFDAIVRHGKQLAATDPDAYLDHIDATNRPEEVCGFCKGLPVGNAATWLDGKPRPPAMCPRCGETNYPPDDSLSAARGSNVTARSASDESGVSGSLVRGGDPDPSLNPRKAA